MSTGSFSGGTFTWNVSLVRDRVKKQSCLSLEFMPVPIYLGIVLFVLSVRRLSVLRKMTGELKRKKAELERVAREITTLKGIIPICMHCRKIRDTDGQWVKLESYISSRTESRFSHGICRDCVDSHYKESADDGEASG